MPSSGSDTSSIEELARFAEQLAAAARGETLSRLATAVAVENKGGGLSFDPVTEADRAAEQAMRKLIEEHYPDHGIQGEEFAETAARSRFAWSLDPIDGTRSYMCGLPTWTTLIALLHDGHPAAGVIDAPRLDETYVGLENEAILIWSGAERSPLRASGCTDIAEARFSTTDPFLFGPTADALQPVLRAVRVSRFGHDAYAYARLAAGDIDLVIECGLKPHDYNALIPIVRGAGGHIGDWKGGTDFAPGDVIAAATKELYGAALALLSGE